MIASTPLAIGNSSSQSSGSIIRLEKPVRVGDRYLTHIELNTEPTSQSPLSLAEPVYRGGTRGSQSPIPHTTSDNIEAVIVRDGDREIEIPASNLLFEPRSISNQPHHQRLHGIVNNNLPDYLKYFQEHPESESVIPPSFKNLRQAIKSHTTDPHTVIVKQINATENFVREVIRTGFEQNVQTQAEWKNVVDSTASNFRSNHPLAAEALNDKTLTELTAYLNDSRPQAADTAVSALEDIEEQLLQFSYPDPNATHGERVALDLFNNEQEKNKFIDQLTSDLRGQAAEHQDWTPSEIIQFHLERHLISHPQLSTISSNYQQIKAAVAETAINLTPTASSYQDVHQSLNPRQIPDWLARDTFVGLGIGQLHKTSRSGLMSNFFQGRSYQNIARATPNLVATTNFNDPTTQARYSESINSNTLESLIKEYGPNFWSHPEAQLVLTQNVFDGDVMSLIRQGYTSHHLENIIQGARTGYLGSGASANDPYLNNLIRLKHRLKIAEDFRSTNPNLLSNYSRFQSWLNQKTRSPFRQVSRYQFGRARSEIRHRIRNSTIGQLPNKALDPFVRLGRLTERLNPFIQLQYRVINPLKRRVKAGIKRSAAKVVARLAKTRLAKYVATKLGLKAILAIAGIGTGGIGTVIMLLAIAKDIVSLIGFKKILQLIVKFIALIAGLLMLFIMALKAALLHALVGAMLGSVFGLPGIIIGGIIGGIWGKPIVSALVEMISSAWQGITQSASILATNIAQFFSNFITSTAAYVGTGVTITTIGVGAGVGIGAVTVQTLQPAEINTLRVNFNDIETDIFTCEASNTPKPSNTGVIISGNYAFPLIGYAGMDACYHWGAAYWAVDIFTGHKNEGDTERHLPIVAYTSGIITAIKENDSLGGIYIIEQGDDGRFYYYAHQCVNYVQVGQRVQAGEVIAISNRTGLNAAITPEHLHFAIEENVSSPDFTDGGNVCPYTDFREKFGIQACDPQYECVQNWNR